MSLLCLYTAPHLEAQVQRAPVPVALIVLQLRHHPRAAHSRLQALQAQRLPVQPAHHGQCHLNCSRWSTLSTPLLAGTRDKQGLAMTRSQMNNLREQQQRITVLKQVAMQPQNQPRPVSAPPAANMPLPPYPQRCPSDMGSRNQVQAENANALCKNSNDSVTDRLQDIRKVAEFPKLMLKHGILLI